LGLRKTRQTLVAAAGAASNPLAPRVVRNHARACAGGVTFDAECISTSAGTSVSSDEAATRIAQVRQQRAST
jgi:hypothetical protein